MDPVDVAVNAVAAALGERLQALWLFGSYVRGAATAMSDIDLAVLCTPPLGAERFSLLDQLGRQVGSVDLIDLERVPASLAWEIITTGRLLVDRADAETERFVRRARHAAEDEVRRNRMVLLAHTGSVGGSAK